MLLNMLQAKGEYSRCQRPCGLKPQVCIRSNVGMAVSNAAEGMECSAIGYLCAMQVAVYAMSLSSVREALPCVCVCACF